MINFYIIGDGTTIVTKNILQVTANRYENGSNKKIPENISIKVPI